MVKGKPWTPATLTAVGGTAGIGVTFLEETFSAATAPAEHRFHQKAARAVLQALLPEQGTDLKGHMRSREELLAASGYAGRLRDFDDLLSILDKDLRLVTPTDPEGSEDEPTRTRSVSEGPADSSLSEGEPTPTRSASEGAAEPSLALRVGVGARYCQLTHD